jgi:para-aminobenzoate synthetase component 1
VRSADFDLRARPERVFAGLAREPYAAFLDSSAGLRGESCRSYIAWRPVLVLRARGRKVEIIRHGQTVTSSEDPLEALRRVVRAMGVRQSSRGQGLIGGLIGYLGYELGGQIESLPMRRREDAGAPDLYFCLYDTVFSYDHARSAWSMSSFSPRSLEDTRRELMRALNSGPAPLPLQGDDAAPAQPLRCNFTRGQYLAAVRRVKRLIRDGEVYQVNLSQRFSTEISCSPWELYLALRRLNPAPYSCYLTFPELVLASSSPELFLRVRGREVETRPIKGTRPRGRSAVEDRALRKELAGSRKDAAELAMIVDLERNDLGRVCAYGSVSVKQRARIEKYATVFHAVARVAGRLAPAHDIVDVIRATFPGGSITGCPKISAMRIIDELERTARGPYTGSIGYIGADGGAELNIAIRTFVIRGRTVSFQVGGGIVADSDPASEYQETLEKGKALANALRAVGRQP